MKSMFLFFLLSSLALAEDYTCSLPGPAEEISEFLRTAARIESRSNCADLQPGEHHVFRKSTYDYATGNYTLRRLNSSTYQAVLNINFINSVGNVTPATMLERARGCLRQAAPFMKGPNGEHLEVLILSKNEANLLPADQRPRPTDVSIVDHRSPNYHPDSQHFGDSFTCPYITHEFMHHLGLCDEYREMRDNYPAEEWNCRVITHVPSLMRDAQNAWRMAIPTPQQCDCSAPGCSELMASSDVNTKKIFFGESIRGLIDDGSFFSAHCSAVNQAWTNDLPSVAPDQSIVVKNQTPSEVTFEARMVVLNNDKKTYHRSYRVQAEDVNCRCSPADTECVARLREYTRRARLNLNRMNCPVGTEGPTTNLAPENILSFTPEPQIPSLLQPNHFLKAIAGTCFDKSPAVQTYHRCEEFAYKGKNNPAECGVPPECYDDAAYLGAR